MRKNGSEKRFVIISPPRTGSTLLRTMLNNLPGVICHGELYAKKGILGYSRKANAKLDKNELLDLRFFNEIEFWNKMDFEHSKLTGFKILYQQLFSLEAVNFLNLLKVNQDIKIIHLWRNDLEARHYSGLLFKYKRGVKQSNEEDIFIKHQCNANQIFSQAERFINWGNFIVDLFKSNPILNISYEEFIKNEDERNKLLDFLGLDDDKKNKFIIPDKKISVDNKVHIELIDKESESEKFKSKISSLPKRKF